MVERKRERLPVSVSAVVFIADDNGKLLLLQQAAKEKGGKWGPPGGGMHPHENPIDTAKREVREEIGVEVDLIDLIGIYTVDRGDEATGLGFVFRGKLLSNDINMRKKEISNYKYFSLEEVRDLLDKGMFYKPEYNLVCVKDWLTGNSYPLDVVKRIV